LTPDALAQHAARALANERELAPLKFETSHKPITSSVLPVPNPIVKAPRGPQEGTDVQSLVADVFGPSEPERPVGAVAQHVKSHQPAASDSDSPSRGIPTASADPGKQVTGGFGDVGEAQYFSLDGTEVRNLTLMLMDELSARIQDDLRFSMAVCYPRVTVRVEIHVEGFAEDQGFVIPKVMPPHERTPVEIAQQHGDQIVFVVVAERQEMTPEGVSVAPPNKLRIEMGLPVPRKQSIETPTGRILVDVSS